MAEKIYNGLESIIEYLHSMHSLSCKITNSLVAFFIQFL